MFKVVLEVFKGYGPVLVKGFPSIAVALAILSFVIALTALSESTSINSVSTTSLEKDIQSLLKSEQENILTRQITASQSDKLDEMETINNSLSQSRDQILIEQQSIIQNQKELTSQVLAAEENLIQRLNAQHDLEKHIQGLNNQIVEQEASLEDSVKNAEQVKSNLSDTIKILTNNTKKLSELDSKTSIHSDDLTNLITTQVNLESKIVQLQKDVSKLTSKVAEASVYAETADAYFEWKYVKAVSSGQPDSEEQINLANETLSNTVLATPNQELKFSFNDWQKSIITHLKEKREGEFLTKLGNLLNAALAPE